MTAFDIIDIKNQNIRVVVDAIRFEEGMTKRDIAEKTNLSFATVSNICNDLIKNDIFCISKQNIIATGRKPNCISLQYERYNTICINLQMKNVVGLAILNIRNETIFEKQYDISHLNSPQEIISYTKVMFEKEYLPNANPNAVYIGVGVAVSAIYDLKERCLVNCSVDMYTGAPLKDIVEDCFQLPTYIDNEANLCAISVMSKKDNNKNVVYLHISEGVGVGIICEGYLVRGHHGYGGEVAHAPVGDIKKICPVCNNYGCVENDLCIPAIVKTYYDNQSDNILDKWMHYIEDVKNGNEKAIRLAEKNAVYLGNLAAILINIFDPETLYIGGDISSIFDVMKKIFMDTIYKRCSPISKYEPRVICDNTSGNTINVGISEFIYNKWDIM